MEIIAVSDDRKDVSGMETRKSSEGGQTLVIRRMTLLEQWVLSCGLHQGSDDVA